MMLLYTTGTGEWILLNPVTTVATGVSYAVAGGTADALTATPAPVISALTDGMLVIVGATATNATTTPTLNYSGLGAKTIVKGTGAALIAGDIASGQDLMLMYVVALSSWILLNPSFVAGGTIRTGSIQNLNNTSYINLNATTTGQTFVQCASAISIMADGQFTFGSSAGKQLIWNGTDLTIGNSSLLGSTAVSTVVSGAANGVTALAGLSAKLNNSAADILSGNVQVQTTGGLRVGTIAWDSSGNLTSGSGIAITAQGIVGATAGTSTFTIDTSGNATFKGALSGATGTFAGSLSAATGTFAGNLSAAGGSFAGALSGATGSFAGSLSAATGSFAGSLSAATGTFAGSLSAATGTFSGDISAATGIFSGAINTSAYLVASGATSFLGTTIYGQTASGVALQGSASGSGTGVSAYSASGNALSVSGLSSFSGKITSTLGTGTAPLSIASTTLVSNLNVQYLNGAYFDSSTSGAATASFPGNNKPGSNTSNLWLPVKNTAGSTVGYVPIWT